MPDYATFVLDSVRSPLQKTSVRVLADPHRDPSLVLTQCGCDLFGRISLSVIGLQFLPIPRAQWLALRSQLRFARSAGYSRVKYIAMSRTSTISFFD